jgi:hypothetical protein
MIDDDLVDQQHLGWNVMGWALHRVLSLAREKRSRTLRHDDGRGK